MALPVPHRRFTVAEYNQMTEAGILKREDRVELINGEIIEMSAINARHAATAKRLGRLFNRRVAESAIVGVQDPIELDDFSEPEPDISLLKPRDDFYAKAHPKPQDVLLVIEVAESSSVRDRLVKMPAYANALIREFWIVDLQAGFIEVYTQPANDSYQSIRKVHRDETFSPQALPDVVLKADEILG
ncbi:MAG: Uma2 family endonuclease [Blastocatellales bacterium]